MEEKKIRLSEGEFKLMEMLWENEPVSAKELSLIAAERIGWNKNTTYTVIKKLNEKGVILRTEPNFICRACIEREEVRREETLGLIKKLYNGSKKALFSALLDDEMIEDAELLELRAMLEERMK